MLRKAGSNCGKRSKLSFLNVQIFHYTKLLLLVPNCVIICLFLSLNIYISNINFHGIGLYPKVKRCCRENLRKISSRLWLSAVNFHGRYSLPTNNFLLAVNAHFSCRAVARHWLSWRKIVRIANHN